MSTRYGSRFQWTRRDLTNAVRHLREHHAGETFALADLARVSLRFTGTEENARGLRDRLRAERRIVQVIARGRSACYRLTAVASALGVFER